MVKTFAIRTTKDFEEFENRITLSLHGGCHHFSLILWGHYDITPKYVKAQKCQCSVAYGRSVPMTRVSIDFSPGKVQGDKNESGTKRLKAILRWLDGPDAPEVCESRLYENSVPLTDFIASL